MNTLIKTLLFVGVMTSGATGYGEWVVTDPGNTAQGIITAGGTVMSYAKQLAQYAKQAQEYSLQIQQYKTQIENLKNLKVDNWADASSSLNQLCGTVNSINNLSGGRVEAFTGGTVGAINDVTGTVTTGNAVVQGFVNDFRSFQNWNTGVMVPGTFYQGQRRISQIEMNSYAASVANLSQQSQNMLRDAQNLKIMINNAKGSTGALQALQAGTQLASAQIQQLTEMRALLIHLTDVTTARAAAQANRENAQDAYTEKMLKFDPTVYKGKLAQP